MFAGCSGGGGGGGTSGTVRVVSFVGGGTDGVFYRDQPLIFEFNNPIDPTSVTPEGFQVRQNGELVPGRVEVLGKVIEWHAVVLPGDRNDYNPPNVPPINGLGLAGATRYTVQMTGGSELVSLRAKNGRVLAESFTATFTTSTAFLPEDVLEPPTIVGDPIFTPAPVVAGDPFSSNPDDWPMLDPRSVAIRLQFSERIHPESLDPFATITTTNVTPGVLLPGVGEPALVRLTPTPTADGVDLKALVSLGDDPNTLDPYIFELRISTGVTDLSRNPIESDIVLHFKTIDRPGETNFLVITENFETTQWRDDSQTTAIWDDGSLTGADPMARSIEYIPNFTGRGPGVPPPNTFNLPHPLVQVGNVNTPFGCSFMLRYSSGNVGTMEGESIVGMAWAPKSRFSFPSTYNDVTLALGHKDSSQGQSLSVEYARNWDRTIPNNPTIVYQGPYVTPADREARWVDWPQFLTDFEYNSSNDMVFFWDMPAGGDTFQLFNNDSTRSTPYNRLFSNGGDSRSRSGRENTQYEFRFDVISKSSFGVSLARPTEFNGKPLSAPDYEAFLVQEDRSRAGTRLEIEWAVGNSKGDSVPFSSFVPSINVADGEDFLAFKLGFTANAFTGTVPRAFSVSYAVGDLDP